MKITYLFEFITIIAAIIVIGGIVMRVLKIILHTNTVYKHVKNFDEKKFLEKAKLMTCHGQSKITHSIGLRNICTLITLKPVNTTELEDRMRRTFINACPIMYSGAQYIEPELKFTFQFRKMSNLYITNVNASFRNKLGESSIERNISLN